MQVSSCLRLLTKTELVVKGKKIQVITLGQEGAEKRAGSKHAM